MTVTLYGSVDSRTARCLWMARELNVPHLHVPTDWRTCRQDPDFLAINAYGMIPALVDGEIRLSESMAINDHLLRTHGAASPLGPMDAAEAAGIAQWTFWVVTAVEKPMVQFLVQATNVRHVPAETLATAQADLQRPLDWLNRHLTGRSWLIAERFTAADLNVASVVEWARPGMFDLSPWPEVVTWLDRCIARPAFQGLSMAA